MTLELQDTSLHLLKSSPFLKSQQITSSSAPTTAWPVLEEPCDECAVGSVSDQIAFDDAEVINPKLLDCSYFLLDLREKNEFHEAQPLTNRT